MLPQPPRSTLTATLFPATTRFASRPAVRIEANPRALAQHGLTLADVRTAIVDANVNQPKGNLDGPQRSITISANDQLSSVSDYEQLILKYDEIGRASCRERVCQYV